MEDIAVALGVVPIRLTYGASGTDGVRINPLDPAIPGQHQIDVLTSMVEIVLGQPLTSDAAFALEVALTRANIVASGQGRATVLSDVFAALTAPTTAMLGRRPCSAEELTEWGMPAAFALHRLVSGNLAGLFDGPTSAGIDLTGRLVIFDLTRLPREGEAMPLFLAVAGAWLRFGWIDPRSTTKYTLVVEEAWHILGHRPVARLFNEFMRFGRRLALSVVAVAHHLSDLRLDEVPEAMSIIKLSATRVVYHIEGEDADTVAEYLELPQWARQAIKDPANLCAPGNGVWSLAGITQLVQHLRTGVEEELTNTNKRMAERGDEPGVPAGIEASASPWKRPDGPAWPGDEDGSGGAPR
ncbi:ATP/GTP-binding protein [Actinomadura sp. CNU-125]|uniref:ATP/GTP-binding protein n=1 Tax=Actinomadura sp. CNU-125 TaxID=1904961 RepID=UPI000964B2F0|nr:ATP/GTP-binding protein [Actinomadura sp. CNU-125]OLT34393.1 ATP/GTP-binding protein [Actinomadura sp. CNU-125]